MGTKGSNYFRRFIYMCITVALIACMAPTLAFARSYEVSKVSIIGEGAPDGSFTITELRTLAFEGEYHAVDWYIPADNSSGLEVLKVGEATPAGDVLLEYPYDDAENPGSWSLLKMDSGETRVSANFNKADTVATFIISYRIYGALKAWADTAELNWQAIGPKTGIPTQDIEIRIKLPVPPGEQVVLGDNVRAWADGPLTGYLTQDKEDLYLTCPRVEPGQYLSVLSAFPVEWLADAEQSPEMRLEAIMAMGADIANAANAERQRARAIEAGVNYGYPAVVGVVSLGGFGFLFSRFLKYGKKHKLGFKDKYWRDVPSEDHPAVIGALYRASRPAPIAALDRKKTANEDLTATFMKLTNDGVLALDRVNVTRTNSNGRTATTEDYMLTLDPKKYTQLKSSIDISAAKMLFGDDPTHYTKPNKTNILQDIDSIRLANTGSSFDSITLTSQNICFSQIKEWAASSEANFSENYYDWKSAIANTINKRGFYNNNCLDWADRMRKIGAVALVVDFFLLMLSIEILPVWPGVMLAVLSVALILMGCLMETKKRRQSPEAQEIVAKTKALRRWLCDFTNLKEAIPTDVVLWNKLLVFATVLGVADRVIEQLKVAVPKIIVELEAEDLFTWCNSWTGTTMAAAVFSSSINDAQKSAYVPPYDYSSVASSSDSSPSGDSGGFGGGGYGDSFGGSSFGGGGFGAR